MKKHEELVDKAATVKLAATPLERMKALYQLRDFLDSTDPLEVFISVDTALSDLENSVPDSSRAVMRELGYLFPEDFDEPKKLLCE